MAFFAGLFTYFGYTLMEKVQHFLENVQHFVEKVQHLSRRLALPAFGKSVPQ